MAKKPEPKYKVNKSAQAEFERALKKVARNAGHIIDAHADGAALRDMERMMDQLSKYAEILGPWAEKTSIKLLSQVARSNARQYQKQSKEMGRLLRQQLGQPGTGNAAPVADPHIGKVSRALLNEQVFLIKSIPLEAGLRAQRIAEENFLNGRRAMPDTEIVDRLKTEMGMSTEVAVNRAKLIARTETARANAAFVETRATSLGVTHYRWRNSGDGAVRDSHKYYRGKKMEGQIFAYDNPPVLDDGTQGHAGTFPNCRCWQDPILPD